MQQHPQSGCDSEDGPLGLKGDVGLGGGIPGTGNSNRKGFTAQCRNCMHIQVLVGHSRESPGQQLGRRLSRQFKLAFVDYHIRKFQQHCEV